MGNVISLKTTQYILYQEKKIPTVMITISTDINKTNNHVSLQTTDDPQKKKMSWLSLDISAQVIYLTVVVHCF